MLCLNVTAGIGILEKAAPIYQDFFPDAARRRGGGRGRRFVALLSAANMAGRIGWSCTSD